MDRRRFLAASVGALTVTAGCTSNASESEDTPTSGAGPTTGDGHGTDSTGTDSTTTPDVPDSVGLETLASGLANPLDIAFVPDADRYYVAEQPGRLRGVDAAFEIQ